MSPDTPSVCAVCGNRAFSDGRCARCGSAAAAVEDASPATVENWAPRPAAPDAAPQGVVPGQPFGDRYHIVGHLGAGGAGQVYQAWDRTLSIPVALKVLRSGEAGASPDADRRLKQELLVARSITHKNVVRIHDIGQAHGISYITMPYIKGGDLASLLKRSGTLPIARALRLARQIAAGLGAAHDAGIVHRDLKPGNILIDEHDQATIVDFGIAYAVDTTLSTMTVEGAIKGTVAYMAPEQALGAPVDARTDVYSFGLVLYEMLAGLRADSDTGSLQDLIQRTRQPPPSLTTLKPDIPAALEAIVSRCLEPEPAKRFQRSSDLAAALEALDERGPQPAEAPPPVAAPAIAPAPVASRTRPSRTAIAALAAAIVAAAAGAWFWRGREAAAPAGPQVQRSLVVANFANTTGDTVFDGTVEEALTIGLESASFLNAFSRREATRLAAIVAPKAPLNEQTARLVAMREGLDLVIGGRVETSGDGFRLSVRGINPDSGAVVTETARAVSAKDRVLDAIGELAKEVRRALGEVPLQAADQSSASSAPETFTAASLEAAHAYTEAQRLADSNRDNEAIDAYKKTVELDPNFGRAYSGLGIAYMRLGRADEARAAWSKALSLVDRMTERERYRTLGVYAQQIANNHQQAIEHNLALVARYPGDSSGFNNLGVAYFNILDFPRALTAGRQAIALSPRRVRYRANEALYAMYASDFEGGRKAATQAVSEDATYFKGYLPLAMAALDAGETTAAVDAYERMSKSARGGASLAAAALADVDIARDRGDAAIARLLPAITVDEQGGNTLGAVAKFFALGDAYLAVDRKADAAAAAERALGRSRRDIDLVAAARILISAGRRPQAAKLAAELNARLPTQSRAYGRIVDGWIALEEGKETDAVAAFLESRKLADFWLGRYGLGIAYVTAGSYGEALAELDACQRRRGEATAIFLDDVPTVRYLTALPYWLARAQEGLGQSATAATNYQRFLSQRGEASKDPLVADARKRLN
jgi:eukaryotic-like serine/threonine-protein kinase